MQIADTWETQELLVEADTEDAQLDNPQEVYWDFVSWACNREHAVIMSLPVPDRHTYFVPVQLDEDGNDVSAFNTMNYVDFFKPKFNTFAYAIQKRFERLYDIATTFSVLSEEQEEAKQRIKEQFASEVRRLRQARHKVEAWQLWNRIAHWA